MLDKNDRKYIIRRIITYIAIAMIMFMISSCQAHALSSQINIDPVNYGNFNCSNLSSQAYGGNWYRGCSGQINAEGWQWTYALDNVSNNYIVSGTVLFENSSTPLISANGVQCQIINTFMNVPLSTDHNMRVGSVSSFICNNVPINGSIRMHVKLNDNSGGNYGVSGYISNPIVLTEQGDSSSTTNAINQVNQNITDSTPPSSSDISGNSSDWNNFNTSNGTINDLVLMPITLLNSFVNGINNSCSSYDLGVLWGEHLILPCINLSQTLGAVWTLIDVIISGVFIFVFGKQCVKIFNDFTNLKSGQIDTLYGGGN